MGKQSCALSSRQKEIIFGTLLGDGRLECRSEQGTARLRVHHGVKQKELVFWKYHELERLVSQGPRKIKAWTNPKDGKSHYSWYFHTITLHELGEFHRMFYQEDVKILPKETDTLLTPLALSVWFMDDGCYHHPDIILNTQNFTLQEQGRIRKTLLGKFHLISGIAKDRDEFRIVISRKHTEKFLEIVRCNVIDALAYKIAPVTTSSARKSRRDGREVQPERKLP